MTRHRVDWTDPRLSAGLYEDMIAVLISRIHPSARRVDGSGGDGGRDVQVTLASGLEIFELKSFTGRVDGGRRTQVRNSLRRAAQHLPAGWQLVVPIDPTPAEEAWFARLTQSYTFPCEWLGKTWLDDKMAAHQDIPRYFLEGSKDEVVELLRELNREQAGLASGVPDLTDRLRVLRDRLNELDPYYTFAFSVDHAGASTITMLPRYNGAEEDRPVTVGGSFTFPETEEGRRAREALRATMDYGRPSTIPSQYVKELHIDAPAGFGGSFDGGQLTFGPTTNSDASNLHGQLRIVDPTGRPLAQLPLFGKERSAGLRGGEVSFISIGGAIQVVLRLDAVTTRMNVHYKYVHPERALPAAILAAVRFLAEAHVGRQLETYFMDRLVGPPIELTNQSDQQFAKYANLVADLDEIQRISGIYFSVPEQFSERELHEIRQAHRLLSGNSIATQWEELSITMTAEGVRSFQDQRQLNAEFANMVTQTDLTITLNGAQLPVGRKQRLYATARLKDIPDIGPDTPPDTEYVLTFVPGADPGLTISLVR
ncbi:hypothetical protein [Hamadaea tsunoensis]|uniref:hypothetical protein n=1 Tax=Hamadaea tsunoensis TaxID=53368 RepID=UPI00040247A1|nr:hypothetical protein [Hamadaea tsunoensis]